LNQHQETILLTLAVKKGLLDEKDVQNASVQENEGKRVDWLVKQGRLDRTTLDLLLNSGEFKAEAQQPVEGSISIENFREPTLEVFPVANWDRYEFEKYLGEGGMGRVFKAFDLRLRRNVALKFMTGTAVVRTKRLIREAQALARIHHDNVCQVYEIGEVEGHLYIAMQYVDGITLNHADVDSFSLREKVRIMMETAEGLHAAHQTGIIHRDIKPANIMIHKTDDGPWHPVLMDFGLAREAEDENITGTGFIVGTPAYMAPEQATLESEQLDRRTDIYSLGATMYNLFTGRAPFSGTTPLEIIRNVNEKDPEPLSRINPKIPEDLQRVIMKCLEKQPERRYQSAKELAEDLQRFLQGEPVLARPMHSIHRKFRRVARNRIATAALIVVAAVALVYLIVTMRSRAEIQNRLLLANEFVQEVRYVDEFMRHTLTAPLHDIRSERQNVRQRLQEFEKRVKEAGPAGAGPGAYVMGRGHLALREPEQARSWLQKAIASDYKVPEVDYAMGLTLGELFQKESEEADRIPNKQLRESRKRELEKEYKEPAIALLRSTQNLQVESPEYAEALILFYDRQYSKSLTKLSEALVRVPWLYEAHVLRGKIYSAQAQDARDRGSNDTAMELFLKADESYRQAMVLGRSDPFSYSAACGLWVQVMNLNLYGSGGDPEPPLKKVRENCGLALKADPDLEIAYLEQSHALKLASEYRIGHGEDPSAYLKESEDLGHKALQLSPRNARAYNQIGMTLTQRGLYEYEIGNDPTKSLKKAMGYLQSSISANPNYIYAHNNLGICNLYYADYLLSRSQDPTGPVKEAINAFEHAIQIKPDYSGAFNNMGNAYLTLAEWDFTHGKDPFAPAQKAVESYQNAVKANPAESFTLQNLGLAYTQLASYEIERNIDPTLNSDKAIQAYEQAIQINPENTGGYVNLAVTFLYRAEYDMEHGKNPEKDLNAAIKNCQKAVELNPSEFRSLTNMGSAYKNRAEYLMMMGKYSDEDFKQAEKFYRKALSVRQGHGSAWRRLGHLFITKAQHELESGMNPNTSFRKAEEALDKAAEVEPNEYEVLVANGQLAVLRAREAIKRGVSPQRDFAVSEKYFSEALKINPDYPQILLARSNRDHFEAEWKVNTGSNADASLDRGLKTSEIVLKTVPGSAQAFLIQGKLLMLKAQASKDSASAGKAVEALQKAISLNSNLKKEAGPLIAKAKAVV
jgi:serine/threonine-protein kinase